MADALTEAPGELTERTFRAYSRWHGALWTHVAELTPAQARWRPRPGRHCTWEIVRHMTTWRRDVTAWYGKFVYAVGVLQHDSSHTGQVAVVRALQGLPPID